VQLARPVIPPALQPIPAMVVMSTRKEGYVKNTWRKGLAISRIAWNVIQMVKKIKDWDLHPYSDN
jgi:hypothetical protein